MKALMVVESIFGNTRTVAEAVAAGLAGRMDVQTVNVTEAPRSAEGLDLLVVGGPTHAFGMTRRNTRRSAADQSGGAVVAADTGLREWLDTLPVGTGDAAAFDTKMGTFWIPGSAAAGAAKRLRRRGFRLVARPHSFRVKGTQGPLVEGEVERAMAWGETLAAQVAGPEPARRTS